METFRPELKVPTTSTDIRKTFAHFRSSWRRKCGTQSCAVTRPTTPDNISLSSSTITLRCPDPNHTLSVKFLNNISYPLSIKPVSELFRQTFTNRKSTKLRIHIHACFIVKVSCSRGSSFCSEKFKTLFGFNVSKLI